MSDFFEGFLGELKQIKIKRPMVHHITNFVTMQDCANMTAAVGASPVMAFDKAESAEITFLSDALVLNLGTPSTEKFEAMILSGKKANQWGKPIVIDPVGIGAASFRKEGLNYILGSVKPSIIKGNASEMKALAGLTLKKNCGVDSSEQVDGDFHQIMKKMALRFQCVIAVTGRTDYVTDGKRALLIDRGTDMLGQISGSGCMTASLIGVFCGVMSDYYLAAIYGILTMNIAGEKAEKQLKPLEGTGSFKVKLFDMVTNMALFQKSELKGGRFI